MWVRVRETHQEVAFGVQTVLHIHKGMVTYRVVFSPSPSKTSQRLCLSAVGFVTIYWGILNAERDVAPRDQA